MTTDKALLDGACVLVVEDDFYQAYDTEAALVDAGAAVLGPFASTAEALERLNTSTPDCAVLDVNLGAGADFQLARTLLAKHIPLVFVTGYEASVLPRDLRQGLTLQKPIAAGALVAAVASLLKR